MVTLDRDQTSFRAHGLSVPQAGSQNRNVRAPANVDAVVAADGARLGVLRLGCAKHLAATGHSVEAFPYHGDDGAGGHVVDETREEFLSAEIRVVCRKVLAGRSTELHGDLHNAQTTQLSGR